MSPTTDPWRPLGQSRKLASDSASDSGSESTSENVTKNKIGTLLISGILMLLIYAVICWLSYDCEQIDPKVLRPLLRVLALFAAAGVGWLFVCWSIVWRGGWADKSWAPRSWAPRSWAGKGARSATANSATVNSSSGSMLLWLVLGFGIAFRLVLLFSVPIQEVDLFRYIWDGTVISQGISPYEYSPQEVEFYPEKGLPNYRTKSSERDDIAKLSAIATSPGMKDAFSLVHFEKYTTPYPLVNQPAFALAAVIGRTIDNFWGLLFAMKGVLTLFDIATAFLIVGILGRLSLPREWVVAYFWCPLLLKEIANSGHLDSIAVFLTAGSVYLMVRTYWSVESAHSEPPAEGSAEDPAEDPAEGNVGAEEAKMVPVFAGSCLIAITLAAAVAAKLFPAVIGPIWAVVMLRRIKFAAVIPLLLFAVTTVLLLWPMVGRTEVAQRNVERIQATLQGREVVEKDPRIMTAPPAGIEAFAKYWEMNDFIFMVTIENLKPYGESAETYSAAIADPAQAKQFSHVDRKTGSKIWFVKTSNEFRHDLCEWYSGWAEVSKREAPFSITRRSTLIVFCVIVLWGCFRVWRHDDPLTYLEIVFLSIAWFWLLAPTQNPWYWTWALPWLVFCRNRVWFFVAFVSMAYYLRFYFEYHGSPAPNTPGLFGTPFGETAFFDFIFPVLEFAPILLALAITWLGRQFLNRTSRPNQASQNVASLEG